MAVKSVTGKSVCRRTVIRSFTRENIKNSSREDTDPAKRHRLSAYDRAYLELALKREAPLATLDKALAVDCRVAGLKVKLT